jgi:hypothetical protein
MQIDRKSGVVSLPNGLEIGPALTQDGFRVLAHAQQARSQDHGTPPWMHWQLSGGRLEGKELLARLCFYDQLLVSLDLSADLYPPGPKDWSNYSLVVEAETKLFHDRLLEKLLGSPSRGASFFLRRLPDVDVTLELPLRWNFAWGSVSSSHDSKGGGTFFRVAYGNRREEASMAYRRRSAGAGGSGS